MQRMQREPIRMSWTHVTAPGTRLAFAAAILWALIGSQSAPAQIFNTIHSFGGGDGASATAPLIQATDGNLYGTTGHGGTSGDGTAFKITFAGTLTTLHSFDSTDGATLWGALVQGTNGSFYGTTTGGGGASGMGTVFKITPKGAQTTLHIFGGADGENPYAGVLQGTNGDFYGTTENGGANGYGAIFRITAAGTLTTLHSFDSTDGAGPQSALVQATDGNFYGTTRFGGTSSVCAGGCGTIFKMTPMGKLTTLHSFDSTDGAQPFGGLVQASDGNLYGTTSAGGAGSDGTVFKITLGGTLTTLHSFDGTDGATPYAVLVQATDGNFYGTTKNGGSASCPGDCGTIFQITPGGTLTTLHSFDGTDGEYAFAGLLQATDGNFYGTTGGGAGGDGTIYSLSMGLGPFVEIRTTSGKEGARVGIVGQGFGSSPVVKFGGVAATKIALTGSSYISATVPAGALTGLVTVTTGATTLGSSQTFKVLPAISSIPASGSVGTSVAITGTGLAQATIVTFDGVAASFTVNSDSQVTATVPIGAKSGKIAVTTEGGSVTSKTKFTVD